MLVGGLGAGGKGVYALDVTSPNLSSESATSGTDLKVITEITEATDG